MKPIIKILLIFILGVCSSTLYADIFLPRIISSGAVLQHGEPNTLWGWANNGEVVSITLNGKQLGQVTAQAGTWKFELPAQKPGGPNTLVFQGNNKLSLQDIYFGDVWIAGGQSNMENPLARVNQRFPDVIPNANNPAIRYFRAPKQYDFRSPKKDFQGGNWAGVTPETAPKMSAVAWFFAQDIHKHHKIPIGIIDNSYGGSAAESWMSEDALKAFPQHLQVARQFQNDNYLQSLINEDNRASSNWFNFVNGNDLGLRDNIKWFDKNLRTADWKTMEIPGYWVDKGLGELNGVIWFRKELILPQSFSRQPGMLEMGRIIDADEAWINGIKVGETGYQYPPRQYDFRVATLRPGKNVIVVRAITNSGKGGFIPDKPYVLRVGSTNMDLSGPWQYKIGVTTSPLAPRKFESWKQPLGFYNAMLAPLLETNIKGVIWYQGETNADRPKEYETLFPAMIRNWREKFNQGDFPFVFVQLPNFKESHSEPQESDWAETRAAQALALNEPNTAMAVTIDVGEWNDIHPTDKKSVGERVALATRKLVYGENNLVASGPTFQSMEIKGSHVRLTFDNVGGGLVIKGDKKSPDGFTIAGSDGKFYWAETKLKKKYLEVWSDKVPEPKRIRYAWADNPVQANLYNKEGLPAPPFDIEVKEEPKE